MKKLLVPVDFSSHAEEALNFAIDFNRVLKGEITILHVLEAPAIVYSFSKAANKKAIDVFHGDDVINAAKEQLTEWSKRVEVVGQQVHTLLEYGNPFQHIAKTIADIDAHYVIMGSKGASGLKEILMGSNTERVVRHAGCPVIVVKSETRVADLKSIVFGTDCTSEQDLIAQHVKDLQKILGANIHMVRILTPRSWLTRERAMEELKAFRERNFMENTSIDTHEADYPGEGVVQYAEYLNADLVTMGTHGKKGIGHFIGGSYAEDAVNESKIPMITYKIME